MICGERDFFPQQKAINPNAPVRNLVNDNSTTLKPKKSCTTLDTFLGRFALNALPNACQPIPPRSCSISCASESRGILVVLAEERNGVLSFGMADRGFLEVVTAFYCFAIERARGARSFECVARAIYFQRRETRNARHYCASRVAIPSRPTLLRRSTTTVRGQPTSWKLLGVTHGCFSSTFDRGTSSPIRPRSGRSPNGRRADRRGYRHLRGRVAGGDR